MSAANFSFLKYVLKDEDHARRAVEFIEMHGNEEEVQVAELIREEMSLRGWE